MQAGDIVMWTENLEVSRVYEIPKRDRSLKGVLIRLTRASGIEYRGIIIDKFISNYEPYDDEEIEGLQENIRPYMENNKQALRLLKSR